MPRGVPRNQSTQRDILHRLKIARGHLDKVIAMVEGDEYCIDIVHQSLAVQAALKKADQALLENHIRHCVAHEVAKGEGKTIADELIGVIKRS
jgi:DNA-binding FrmR family transcriptional regulator